MNKKQFAYHTARAVHSPLYPTFFTFASSIFGAKDIIHNYKAYSLFSILLDSVSTAFVVFCGIKMYQTIDMNEEIAADKNEIEENKEKYLLEHVSRIIIDDVSGLENVLERTDAKERLEWGTFLKSHVDRERAIVHKILSPDDEIIYTKRRRMSLILELKQDEEDYNGYLHYHPLFWPLWYSAVNYSINFNDRLHSSLNSINFLTFNMPEGPEIIGFNTRYTYISKTRENKRELVRATPEDIVAYLSN